ncbi:hypothetical protein MUK42_12211 [Musa troglodytarum]|uniref:Cysteine protease n=1 Tax=Musa troglodytarum TaxID=320322 RepID=A0A9E7KFM6_9LILI|nr:hypothetical protein MUK42_12211 [Musa troglodytarum]
MFLVSMRKSFKDSLKVLEADIQHANSLASDFPREYDGACLQMRMSYSPAAHLFLFLVQWTDCNLAGALGLLRVLIYKVYVDGKTTMSIQERKASIKEFYGVIFPSLIQLQKGITDMEDKKQKSICVERYRRREDDDKQQLSEIDVEREEECGICMETNSKVVLPNCGHAMCIRRKERERERERERGEEVDKQNTRRLKRKIKYEFFKGIYPYAYFTVEPTSEVEEESWRPRNILWLVLEIDATRRAPNPVALFARSTVIWDFGSVCNLEPANSICFGPLWIKVIYHQQMAYPVQLHILVMTGLLERVLDSKFPASNSDDSSVDRESKATNSDQTVHHRCLKASFLTRFFRSIFSVFERHSNTISVENKTSNSRSHGWVTTLKKVMTSGPMRRLQERIQWTSRADTLSLTSDIWFLGKCYKLSLEESSHGSDAPNSYDAFLEDFLSRIWITYRKSFDPIGDSKFTCDVNWGCMIRSSQMLVAQPHDPGYIEILHLFGDSEACAFSVHNLLQAGKGYGLAAGSWLGPYAMCRTWETLAHANKEQVESDKCKESLPMVLYTVSGDEDGERGGAPVISIKVAARLCYDFSKGQLNWAPILLLVPLVLGLEKINPRYIPLLWETFTFPQSLGILGGRPGASTYIVGIQDNKALYLDPHEVQLAVDIKRDDLEADISSYHCSTVRHVPLDMIDPSLAIGFYCRDKDDFEDLCSRASKLADKSNGAPLFTVAQNLQPAKPVPYYDLLAVDTFTDTDDRVHEDEWQIL